MQGASKMGTEIKKLGEVLLPKYLSSDAEMIQCNTTRLIAAGENYGSLMLAIDIKIRNKDTGKECVLNIVGKAVPQNEFIQKMIKTPLTFKKELEFYRCIVPTLQDFQRENGIEEVMDFFPEFYGGRMGLNKSGEFDNDAVILLENLKVKGYVCADRTKGFDLDAAKYILRDLAIFHAVPLAMKIKQPEVFKKKILPHINFLRAFHGLGDDILHDVVDGLVSLTAENEECIPILRSLREKLLTSANSVKNPLPPREPFSTVVHHDFWVNNIMIKIRERKIIENKIVDFQMPEYGSPAKDLMFFIFDSIQNEVIVNCYDELVTWYHQNFIKTLKQFDVDTEPFSMEAFQKEIDLEMQDFVLFQCFFMLKPIFATQEIVKEIEDMNENDLKEEYVVPQIQKEKLWTLVKEFRKRNWL